MGVNQGKVFPDANDPKMRGQQKNIFGAPLAQANQPVLRQPQLKDTSKASVPAYLQRAVGGINHQPQAYRMPGERSALDFVGGPVGFGDPRAPKPPTPTTATTTQQPAQAAI
jgi:hypothetical protein